MNPRLAPSISTSVPAGAGAGVGRVLRTMLLQVPSLLLVLTILASLALAVGPRVGAYRTISILSGSMEPSFAAGDVVVSTQLPAGQVRVGDVITFHAPVEGAPLVTHRVTRIVERGEHPVIRSKGDANRSADPWSARLQDDVVWRQCAVIPYAGTVIHQLRRPVLQQGVLYGSLAVFLLVGLRSVWVSPRTAAT